MKELLILTGAPGVGKSTVSTDWAKINNAVIIHGDEIAGLITSPVFHKWSKEEEHLIARTVSKIAEEHLNENKSVVIDYVWSPDGLLHLHSQLEEHAEQITCVLLQCTLEENIKRDQERKAEHQMKERVEVVLNEFNNYYWPAFLHQLDTTKMDVQDTLSAINKISKNFGASY